MAARSAAEAAVGMGSFSGHSGARAQAREPGIQSHTTPGFRVRPFGPSRNDELDVLLGFDLEEAAVGALTQAEDAVDARALQKAVARADVGALADDDAAA